MPIGDAVAQHRNTEDGAKAAQSLCFRPGVFGVVLHVGDMNDFTFEQGAPGNLAAFRFHRHRSDIFEKLIREPVGLSEKELRALLPSDRGLVGLAQSGGRLDERLQHRLQVEGGAADHLEHVGGGGLLLQRFAQLVEQAGVLDGDYRLVGECLQHIELLLRQRPRREPNNADGADRGIAPQHRHDGDRAVASRQEIASAARQLKRALLGVGNVHHPGVENGDAVHVFAGERNRKPAPYRFDASGIRVGGRCGLDLVPVRQRDHDRSIRKQLEPALHDGIEHRLGVVERVADHSENVGGGGLLLERFAELAGAGLDLVEQPHVLDRDHRLVREGRDKVDLFVGERLHRVTHQ